ncbi:MAG: hypothetical protein HOW97_17130 [Catenulispora sp.]|nr:hypothetical protein [Catenulispora sp.]
MSEEMSAGTEALAADLALAGIRLAASGNALLMKGALNIKNDWRTSASGLKHAPLYPASITFDVIPTPTVLAAEIGPDKNRPQGALGNLIEYGSVKNPPHLDGARALAAEEPRFYEAASNAAAEAVFE